MAAESMSGPPPGPRGWQLLQTLLALRRDPLSALVAATREHGDLVHLRLLHRSFYLATHPDHVDHVLHGNAAGYSKRTRTYAKIRGLLGEGLVTSEGEAWQRQRRLVQGALSRDRIMSFAPLVTELAHEMLEGWKAAAAADDPIAVDSAMRRLTLRIVARSLLGKEIGSGAGSLGADITVALDFTARRAEGLADPGRLPTPARRRFHRSVDRLDHLVMTLIDQRRRRAVPDDDLLGLLLRADGHGDSGALTDREVRDQVVTLLLAGHETTAASLSWAIQLLSRHPTIQARLRTEAESTLASHGPASRKLDELGYTRRVLYESMRLYPPVWMIERRAIHDDVIGNYRIPAGSTVALSQYVTHRHSAFWDDPERFDPDRFHPDRAAHPTRSAYFPFGGGPRSCVGAGFAMMEAPLILAMIIRRYRVEPAGPPAAPHAGITLRPRTAVLVRLREQPASPENRNSSDRLPLPGPAL